MAERPNELWVADITFLPTLAGFLYLAVVLDAWSRRIVGWAFSADLKTRVVLDALDMALVARNPTASSITRIVRINASFRGPPPPHPPRSPVEGGFKRSSQRDLCRLIGETGQAPLRVSSNQASFGAAS